MFDQRYIPIFFAEFIAILTVRKIRNLSLVVIWIKCYRKNVSEQNGTDKMLPRKHAKYNRSFTSFEPPLLLRYAVKHVTMSTMPCGCCCKLCILYKHG